MMAKPIQPTPTLRGEDAERLLRDLVDACTPAEAERRIAYARRQLAEMTRAKIDKCDGCGRELDASFLDEDLGGPSLCDECLPQSECG